MGRHCKESPLESSILYWLLHLCANGVLTEETARSLIFSPQHARQSEATAVHHCDQFLGNVFMQVRDGDPPAEVPGAPHHLPPVVAPSRTGACLVVIQGSLVACQMIVGPDPSCNGFNLCGILCLFVAHIAVCLSKL